MLTTAERGGWKWGFRVPVTVLLKAEGKPRRCQILPKVKAVLLTALPSLWGPRGAVHRSGKRLYLKDRLERAKAC